MWVISSLLFTPMLSNSSLILFAVSSPMSTFSETTFFARISLYLIFPRLTFTSLHLASLGSSSFTASDAQALACIASGWVESAPIPAAYSSETGAPPIITTIESRIPSSWRISMTFSMLVMVVVIRALMEIRSALFSFAVSINFSIGTSAPRSIILKPPALSIVLTRFFPMSCTSPSMVPITPTACMPDSAAFM